MSELLRAYFSRGPRQTVTFAGGDEAIGDEHAYPTVSSPGGIPLPVVDTALLREIFSRPTVSTPRRAPSPVTKQIPQEIVSKPSPAGEIARIRKIFQDYDPTTDTVNKDKHRSRTLVLNPGVALKFNETYGRTIRDDAQLFMLMTHRISGATFDILAKDVRTVLGTIVNAVSRVDLVNPIVTVGDLREADIESILEAANNKQLLTPRSLVFAQFALKK